MKIFRWFILFSLVAFVSCESRIHEYKIGVIYNLEGSQSSLDIPSAKGAELAAELINSQDGINGRKLTLILYDGKSDPSVIKKATRKLIFEDKVSVIIGFNDTDMVLASAPIAAENEVIFITSGATSPKLPEQVPAYLFLSCFGDNVQAAVLAEYSYERHGLSSCYVLTDENMDFTKLLSRYFMERYTELGGKILKESFFKGGEQDYSDFVVEIQKINPQPKMLFVSAGPDDVGNIIAQFRAASITQPIFGGDSYDTPLLLETAGATTDEVYYTTHFLVEEYTDNIYFTTPPTNDQEVAQEPIIKYITSYKDKYGTIPVSSFAALGYDAVMLVADMYRRASGTKPEELLSTLSGTKNFPGVTGMLSYVNGQRIPQKGVTLIKILNGKLVFLESIVPTIVSNP
ncbi:MAG: ABC transporter substrate-binding protein [Candidatus Cloacimonetes bacterium]|nr:ABC transporter substrate-binding protein [Candidatus Cloacimonadota bacterium]